jgi:2-polyprenyl-6-methoxyphenol hydroxylase-like FAD-dependent oxidoreductase
MSQPAKATTVTIIGAGLGGIALVANLGLLGYRLRLHDRDESQGCASAVGSTSKAWPRGLRRSSS